MLCIVLFAGLVWYFTKHKANRQTGVDNTTTSTACSTTDTVTKKPPSTSRHSKYLNSTNNLLWKSKQQEITNNRRKCTINTKYTTAKQSCIGHLQLCYLRWGKYYTLQMHHYAMACNYPFVHSWACHSTRRRKVWKSKKL